MPTGEHSKQYDEELEAIRSRVLQMGGLVESQVRARSMRSSATRSLRSRHRRGQARSTSSKSTSTRWSTTVIARRQPTAGDLRMITGVDQGDHRPGADRRRGEQDRARSQVAA